MICLMSDVNTWYMVYEQIRLKWLDTAVQLYGCSKYVSVVHI